MKWVNKMKPLFKLLTELSSRKTISKWTGRFAKSRMSKGLIRPFIKTYKIQLEEAEQPIESFHTLNQFFTRKLKPGARPIDAHPNSIISPVDGKITGMGRVHTGRMIDIKGQHYDLLALLNDSPRSVRYEHGYFIVLYLSPSDYHRIHAPVSGIFMDKEHIAGKVYPVHDFSMRHIPQVLSRNERLVSYWQTEQFGEVAVVKVGALNVSSVRYNEPLQEKIVRGEELAWFEFGSTVVVLIESEEVKPCIDLKVGDHVKMGQRLGLFHHESK